MPTIQESVRKSIISIWAMVRFKFIRILAWFQQYLPCSVSSRLKYGSWLDDQLQATMALLDWKPSFDEIRPGLEETFSENGTPLRWIHPMTVKNGMVTDRIEVSEGTIVIGNQGEGNCFAYLDPAKPSSDAA